MFAGLPGATFSNPAPYQAWIPELVGISEAELNLLIKIVTKYI